MLQPDLTPGDSPLSDIETFLINGNLAAACSAAASSGFWLEAMLISKHINTQAMGAVTRDYIQKATSGVLNAPKLQDYPALALVLAALGGVDPETGILILK